MRRRDSKRHSLCVFGALFALFLLSLAPVQAQFTYITNNGTITITWYTGPPGPLVIPDTIDGLPVTLIDWGALSSKGLTSVSLPNGLKELGDYALEDNPLTNVIFPETLLYIDRYVFFNCDGLFDVTIPNSVLTIGDSAFSGCDNLTNFTMGSGVQSIGPWTFLSSANLATITVSPSNGTFSSIDGVLFNKSGTTLVRCPE